MHHDPCYMLSTMIRTLLICSTLIGASAAGAFALATLHDTAMPQAARLDVPAPRAQTAREARFVAPTFAPSQAIARSAPGLPNDAVVPTDDTPLVLTPMTTSADPDVAAPSVTDRLIPPSPETKMAARPAPKRVAKPAVRSTQRQTAAALPKPKTTGNVSSRAKMRPVIVAQTSSFSSSGLIAAQPDYVIGVYR